MKKFSFKTAFYSLIIPIITALFPEIMKLKNQFNMNWIFYLIPVFLFVFMYWLISYIQETKDKNKKLLNQIDEIISVINNHADCLDTKISQTHEPIKEGSLFVKEMKQITPLRIKTKQA